MYLRQVYDRESVFSNEIDEIWLKELLSDASGGGENLGDARK